ncbi:MULTISPECIES: LacI family DNA-binding transcriptional regulator [unclassified Rathayibacter]|uniref:LacI family DNA-binding transcriptional regulator n=1 Tax=unclassified Rathayibacter TaxID=2609250 RepID=UPI00188C3F4F|nr:MULTISPECIES: LacI family DNA-binding transcriptional regulator [unclassified Rathayibacter]MBF4461305.1 LacI family DNA-binding transcriptional regulator [Rathayibacter sp. VKM Ac-2879]MBF4502716.1 LacI family DNA-binding transcriptional regulator [Rathayibacter sp. VKM Ac-2878]
MATIGDVAKAAGVSRSTVSYAISGKRAISPDTRRRIQAAIDELDFTVNAGARALATRRTMALGVLVHFDPDEFAPAMMEYLLPITTRARELGYDILLTTDRDGAAALTRLSGSGLVDGVILLSVATEDERLPALRTARRPGAAIGVPADAQGVDVFDLDFGAAAQLLVEHLAGLGHRRIGLVTPPERVFERGGTYCWRFREAALETAERLGIELAVRAAASSAAGIEPMVSGFLDENPDLTGLIVHSDRTVAMLPSLLGPRGIRVPDDLAVVGLYSAEFARDFTLPYSFVETGPSELGTRVVDAVVERIEGLATAGSGTTRLLAARLVDRGSTRRL